MAALDYLFQGSPPPAVTTAAAASNGLPEWYAQLLQGTAGKAIELAGQQGPVAQQSVAGFTADEAAAQDLVRSNTGAWQNRLDGAYATAGSALPGVNRAVETANKAVAGPAKQWTSNFQQYMSPYTAGVVDEIGRLGARNFNENIMPGVNASMIGTGNFGSTRNADVLSNAARDASADITGQQATALQQGYGMSADIFAGDANRAQQQQQMQAGTALTGANTAASAAQGAAAQQGALAQAQGAMGLADAQALDASGRNQRALTQAGYDAAFANQQAVNNAPWETLNNVNSVVRGMQLPATRTAVGNGPASVYQPGALAQAGAGYGMIRS